MRSYTFQVEVEPDDDRWFARVPELEAQGAAAWGYTRDEALRNIQEVAELVIGSMIDEGVPLPPGIHESVEPTVSITI